MENTKKALVPKLRFKGFANDWTQKTFSEMSVFINGKAYKQEELLNEGKYKVLRVGNLFSKSDWYYSDLELEENKYVDKGDLMYAWSASFGPHFWSGPKTIYHYHIWKVIPSKNSDKTFLYYTFQVDLEKIKSQSQGGTMFHITKGNIEQRKFHFPTLSEQQKIASFLSAVDDKIRQLTRKKELLEQYKKGVMQKLFSGKLRFKDDKGKAFPEWEEKRLGDVATFYNGKAYTQSELLDSGKYRVLRVGNFFSNSSWYYSNIELEANKYCDKGDLLYAWSASFGPKIWDGEKTIYHYHIWKVENNKWVTKQFLFHILNHETEVIKTRSSNGFALLHITKGTIEGWKCKIPTINEQYKISSFVDKLNKRLENVDNQITQAQSFKKGLLQQMFV